MKEKFDVYVLGPFDQKIPIRTHVNAFDFMVLLQKWFQLQCAAIFQRISAAASNQITPPQFCDPKQKMGFCVNWWLPWSCMPNMALSHMCCMWNAQYEYLWIFQSGSSERFDDAFFVNFWYSERATKIWPIIHL
jgi:hypothetical protein